MPDYRLVPVEKLKEWEATINTIALQTAFDIADDIAQYSYASAVKLEPVDADNSPGWKEAAIAWKVCASIHREWAKGKDVLFNTRQAAFTHHAEEARAAYYKGSKS